MAAHGPAHRAAERVALLLHGTALAHRARTALPHRTALLLHGTALAHGAALLHRTALAHRTGAVLTLRTGTVTVTLRAVAARSRGKLGRATGQLRRTHLRLLPLRRSGYGGGHRAPLPFLRFGWLAHALLLLVLRGGARRGGQLRAQVLVLTEQAGQFGLDLVEKGIDLVLVIAFSEADGRELLVPHVLRGQRHLYFTST
ncbi:hypothetical protein GCM10009654_52410 [Streptomyces hebeiensis]|uniref:Uncharacterized protein n=1 Tax=Streptomyces hebeiensis TaxID=229486 RepID=A0ABN1V1D9_9ACTN